MAFITNKKRNKLVNKLNENAGGRKIFLFTMAILSIVWIGMVFIAAFLAGLLHKTVNVNPADWNWFYTDNDGHIAGQLTKTGWVLSITGGLCMIGLLLSAVLIIIIPSPAKIKDEVNLLSSSALSGKKITKNDTSAKAVKERFKKVEKRPKK
ncbi:hypothetical protein MGM1_1990 [Candidatus Malacoplasma girerdii]|uniref:Uncharacterized protein n=1 Tax=Candidatus Malacoplasma girerdii TaxID=1318617 RepID=A0A097SSK7_9BACT|nr:hypothetical protein MGM1_1990 [Candidatus Malacoplasma girerdii]ASJ89055.1 MAG: hypothetical protein B1217_0156 [Candidatus Malacoplasma girerdii]